jgi:sacsin
LIQNADDAGATEVSFLIDGQSFASETSSLLQPELSQFQGEAFYAQNNAIFQDKDWHSIQCPQRSVKKDDPLKIGKFGIGFNSVYHLTGNMWSEDVRNFFVYLFW